MEDLIFHMFFVVPLTRCITSSDRPWNKKNPRCGTMLAVLALFIIGVFQSRREEMNYYEILGVTPNAPPRVVSAAYRKLAVQYHPDKNPHPDAKEAFAKIREAYGVLANEKRRSSYLRFGDYSKEGDVDEEQFYDVLFLALFQLLIPFLLAFLYTYKADAAPCREIFSCYVATSFALELLLRFDERATHYLTFVPFVGNWLPFEKVQLLHAWMPLILNGLLLLGSELASNEDETFDDATRSAVDWRLDLLVYMERYLHAAENVLKNSKTVETRRRWALRIESDEKTYRKEGEKEGTHQIVTAAVTRSGLHMPLDTDAIDNDKATKTDGTCGTPKRKLLEYKLLSEEEERAAERLFQQIKQVELERQTPVENSEGTTTHHTSLLSRPDQQQQQQQRQQQKQPVDMSITTTEKTSPSNDSSSASSQERSIMRFFRKWRRNSRTNTVVKVAQTPVQRAVAEDVEEVQTYDDNTTNKSIEEIARRKMKEKGYIQVLQYVKPWRLDPNNVSDEMPDLWAEVMADEIRAWDEEEEKIGKGISLGSIIFFGSLFLRWYTGSG